MRIRTCLSKPRVVREHKSLGKAPPDVTPLDFCLWGCKKSEIDKIKADTRDELLARIFDAAARINKREGKLRQTIRDLRTRVAKCTKVDCVIYEHLF